MEQYSYTSTHPLGHTGPVTGSLYLYLYILVPFLHTLVKPKPVYSKCTAKLPGEQQRQKHQYLTVLLRPVLEQGRLFTWQLPDICMRFALDPLVLLRLTAGLL